MSEAILNTSKAIQNATPTELKQLAQRFASSSQKAAQTYAPMIEQAIGPNGQVRKSALFALYQQPAFRELMRSSDIVGQGADQSPLSESSNLIPPSSDRTPTYVPPTENEDEDDLQDLKTTQGLNNYLKTIALIESNGNPSAKAKTSSASGMFQFTEGTWKQITKEMGKNYSLKDRFDPKKATEVAAYFSNKQKNQLENNIGRSANSTDLYMSHFLGVAGASKFLNTMSKNPNKIAASLYPEAAKANRSIYYDNQGRARTMKQVYDLMDKKVKIAEQKVAEGKINKSITDIDLYRK